MVNIFENLITDDMKELHCQAVRETIRAASVDCLLIYGTTNWTECPNCIFDPLGNKSSGKMKSGAAVPFHGICPVCLGLGRIANDTTTEMRLAPIYSQKYWITRIPEALESPNNWVETLSLLETFDELKEAKEILINTTDFGSYVRNRYQRYGEPLPCGLGGVCFIETMWKRVEN